MTSNPPNRQRAIVVLGCAVPGAAQGLGGAVGTGALGRRVVAAAREWDRASREDPEGERPVAVVASGGRAWDGEMEADAMARALVALGVPPAVVVRERMSLHTRDNALFTAAICGRRGIGRVTIVTCGWHLARARMLFEMEGLEVAGEISAGEGDVGWVERAWIRARERAFVALSEYWR